MGGLRSGLGASRRVSLSAGADGNRMLSPSFSAAGLVQYLRYNRSKARQASMMRLTKGVELGTNEKRRKNNENENENARSWLGRGRIGLPKAFFDRGLLIRFCVELIPSLRESY